MVWLVIKLLVVSAAVIYLAREFFNIRDGSLRFAFAAVLSRFLSSAFHEYTYQPLMAGLSINALLSIFVAGFGMCLIPKRYLLLRSIVPFYAFWMVILISGVINGQWIDLINVATKWLFFLAVCVSLYDALSRLPGELVLSSILKIYCLPLGLQFASVIAGYGKATEADGSISFIGGYNHEAAFSMMLIGFIYLVIFIPRRAMPNQWLYLLVGLIGLLLANYRTSIIAVLPCVAIYFYYLVTERLASRDKVVGFCVFLAVGILAAMLLAGHVSERYADISTALTELPQLWVEPRYYSITDQQLFSARAYIWSQYISGFARFDLLHAVIGRGPEAWVTVFTKYAHNTYISYLYEYGWVGLFSFIFLTLSLFLSLVPGRTNRLKAALLSGLIGFLILNLATMPLWNIEGLIVFSVLVSVIFDYRRNYQMALLRSRI